MLSTLRSLRTDTPQAMTRHRMFAVAVALTLPTVVSAQVGARRTPLFAVDARAVARLDSVARATLVTHKLAGLSVAVVRDGRELLVRAYGKADLALGVPTPDDAVYEIGSVTKQFTAAAVLQLVEAGRLSLDADIATLLPSYNAQGRRITLRRLLDHTSGIPGYTEMSEFGALMTQPLPRDSLVTLIGSKGFNFEPGTAMRYNNSAYFLLGLIIERASGEPYGTYVERHLFSPAGMTKSHYCSTSDVVARSVQGYDMADGTLRRARYLDQRWPYAAGSLCSTTRDLVAWTRALHGGRVLGANGYRELLTAGVLLDGTRLRYAAGLAVGDSIAGHRAIFHDGAIPGFASALAYLPDERLTVALLINTLGAVPPNEVVKRLVVAAVGDRTPASRALAGGAGAYEGSYYGTGRDGQQRVLHVSTDANGLRVRFDRDSAEKARWLGGDTFGVESMRLVFMREGGVAARVRVDDVFSSGMFARDSVSAEVAKAAGVAVQPLRAVDRARYVGSYPLHDSPGGKPMAFRIFEQDGQLAGQIRTNDPTKLDYLGGDRFRPADAPDYVVTFSVSGNRATRVVLQGPGARLEGAREGAPPEGSAAAPASTGSPLDVELARMDSLLFDAAFVSCDTARIFAILTPDVEFYHDLTGFHRGAEVRADFARLAAQCPRGQGVTRVLTPGSLQHFPIKDFGVLQVGLHRFENARGGPPVAARFFNLWTNRSGRWQVSRVYSVDHGVRASP